MEPVRALAAAAAATAPPLPPKSASNGSSSSGGGGGRGDCGGTSWRAPCPVDLLVPPQAAVVVVTGPNTGGAPPSPPCPNSSTALRGHTLAGQRSFAAVLCCRNTATDNVALMCSSWLGGHNEEGEGAGRSRRQNCLLEGAGAGCGDVQGGPVPAPGARLPRPPPPVVRQGEPCRSAPQCHASHAPLLVCMLCTCLPCIHRVEPASGGIGICHCSSLCCMDNAHPPHT